MFIFRIRYPFLDFLHHNNAKISEFVVVIKFSIQNPKIIKNQARNGDSVMLQNIIYISSPGKIEGHTG